MQKLVDIHMQQVGKSSDKWSSYFPTYERLFSGMREQPVRMLEIGVQNGGSLDVWTNYFKSAEVIVGCDINDKCALLRYDDDRVRLVIGDANTEEVYSAITRHSEYFDIVVDDGSHVSDDVINSFLIYFPMLSPGGVYVVEDTHCLYWDAFQGGVLKQNSAYAFFKLVVDLVSYEHWKTDLSIESLFSTFFPKHQIPPLITNGWIDGIEFSNSMIVIHKAKSPSHEKLGQRLIVGNDALVVPETLEIRRRLHGVK